MSATETSYECPPAFLQTSSGFPPHTGPKQRAGNSETRPSLSSSHPPFLLSRSWKHAQIRAGAGGKQGSKESWTERKEKVAKDLGDVCKARTLKGCSRPWVEKDTCDGGGVGTGCWGHFCPSSVSAQGRGGQGGAIFPSEVLTASRCGSAHSWQIPCPSLICHHPSIAHTPVCVLLSPLASFPPPSPCLPLISVSFVG